MSRRSIFILAATVVLLYFSIILFMLNPLHGSKNSYYGSNYMNHLSMRQVPSVNWCKELQWRTPPSANVAALVSYPGSGNTWLRYLLQQATGLLTGSIYMDYGLRVHGFPAENVTDGSVLVVKTHEAPPLEPHKFKSAVLLIRNPRDAILADFNRLHKGHIGTAPKSAFKKKNPEHSKSDWSTYVITQLSMWETLHRLWLTRFPGPVHVVFYEILVRDTRTTIEGILNFLNHTYSELTPTFRGASVPITDSLELLGMELSSDLNCGTFIESKTQTAVKKLVILNKEDIKCMLLNKEGIYRRKKKHKDFDPYTEEMYKSIEEVKNRVLNMVAYYQIRHNGKMDTVLKTKS